MCRTNPPAQPPASSPAPQPVHDEFLITRQLACGEAGAVRLPSEVTKIRRLSCNFPASFEWHPTTETGVHAPFVDVGGESIQLAMQVETVPEEGVVEILAPKSSDQPLDERM